MFQTLLPNTILRSRYRVIRLVASSHQCQTYAASDKHLKDRLWILKQYSISSKSKNRSLIIKDYSELCQLLTELGIPQVFSPVDYFAFNDSIIVVRALIPGAAISSFVQKRGGHLSQPEVVNIGIQICDIVSSLVKHQFPPYIFRDLTLENLIIDEHGKIHWNDFGFSGIALQGTLNAPAEYASQEQFENPSLVNQSTLVYNIGAMLHHLGSGKSPSHTPFQLKPLHLTNPSFDQEVSEIIDTATDNLISTRYQTLSALRQALYKKRGHSSVPTKPKRHRDSTRELVTETNWVATGLWMLTGLIGVVIAFGLTLFFLKGDLF